MPTKLKSKTSKPKKRTAFQGLVTRIKRSNKRFEKADQAGQILMVAEDVLDLLQMRRIKAATGIYVEMPVVSERKREGIKDVSEFLKLPRLPACIACAIGAGMIAATMRLNNVPIVKLGDGFGGYEMDTEATFSIDGDGSVRDLSGNMSKRALDVFPEDLLRSMESAFEHSYYGYNVLTAHERLKAIYENLVKNKGKKFTARHSGEVVWP